MAQSPFSVKTPIPFENTTEHENPLCSLPVIFDTYILHGAYRYESGYLRVMGRKQCPLPPAHTSRAPPEPHRSTSVAHTEVLR